MNARCAEQAHRFFKHIGDLLPGLIIITKHHLKFVNDNNNARHLYFGEPQPQLTNAFRVFLLQELHSALIFMKKGVQHCETEADIAFQSKRSGMGQIIRLPDIGEGLKGDAFLKIEKIHLQLSGRISHAKAVNNHRDQVGFALTNRTGNDRVVALVDLVSNGDLHVVDAVFSDTEGQAIHTALSPEPVHVMQLRKTDRGKLRRTDFFHKRLTVLNNLLCRHRKILYRSAALNGYTVYLWFQNSNVRRDRADLSLNFAAIGSLKGNIGGRNNQKGNPKSRAAPH